MMKTTLPPEQNLEAASSALAPLRLVKTVRLDAPPEAVFELVSDHAGMPAWFPAVTRVQLDEGAATTPGGDGTLRHCTLVDGQELDERIVGFDPPHGFGYAVSNDNAIGLRDHLATIELEPAGENATQLTWRQRFHHPDPTTFACLAGDLLDAGIEGLRARFGGGETRTEYCA